MDNNKNSSAKTSTVAQVLNSIRNKIILQEYKAGSSLTEIQLSNEYNASRGTIREAMRQLTNEGLIITLSNGRRQVVGITEKFIHDLYSLRKLLECKAVKEIIEMKNVGFSVLASVVEDFQRIETASEEELRIERPAINSKFHRVLFEMTDNIPLLQCWITIEPIIDALAMLNSVNLDSKNHQEDYIDTHVKILELLIANDPAIVEYIVYHVDSALRDTLAGYKKFGTI